MTAVLSLLLVAALVGVVVRYSYSGLVAALTPVEEAWAGLLARLDARHDLAGEVVSGLRDSVDAEDLAVAADLETACAGATERWDVAARAAAETAVARALDTGLARIEHDPRDREASDLRTRAAVLDEDIQVARALYDALAQTYMTRASMYPGRHVARWAGLPQRPAFEIPERRLPERPS